MREALEREEKDNSRITRIQQDVAGPGQHVATGETAITIHIQGKRRPRATHDAVLIVSDSKPFSLPLRENPLLFQLHQVALQSCAGHRIPKRLGRPWGRVKDGFAEDGVAANSLASYTQGKVGVTGEQQPVTRE